MMVMMTSVMASTIGLNGGTDNDGDGELEGVALRNELLESLNHGDPF